MLKNKQVIFHIKRYAMSNVYISTAEAMDLLTNLTPTEHALYITIKGSVLLDVGPDWFKNKALATTMSVAESTIKNARSSLKKKGYMVIKSFLDEDSTAMVRVVLGKDQVTLYNLGLKVEISDARAYKELTEKFDILNPTLSKEQREEHVRAANEHYLKSIK